MRIHGRDTVHGREELHSNEDIFFVDFLALSLFVDVEALVKDKLAKLGYRLRPRSGKTESHERPGEVAFDDRGNAVYQWNNQRLTGDNEQAEELRYEALRTEGLALVEDEPPPEAMIRANPKGTRLGYNPYQSGMSQKKPQRKTDLRELSRWIEMKRKLEPSKK